MDRSLESSSQQQKSLSIFARRSKKLDTHLSPSHFFAVAHQGHHSSRPSASHPQENPAQGKGEAPVSQHVYLMNLSSDRLKLAGRRRGGDARVSNTAAAAGDPVTRPGSVCMRVPPISRCVDLEESEFLASPEFRSLFFSASDERKESSDQIESQRETSAGEESVSEFSLSLVVVVSSRKERIFGSRVGNSTHTPIPLTRGNETQRQLPLSVNDCLLLSLVFR